jgi:ubiquinone/menaquinone biosynthesis C-methylase UbiE
MGIDNGGVTLKEFTKIAIDYDKGRRGEDIGFWAGEVERFGSLGSDSWVLDLGCGTGLYTEGIAEKTSASMCGLDPAVGMLAQARMKSTSVHWFNAVGENLPLRPGVFDCVFSSQVWHHITDKQGTAHECGRVLKGDRVVIIRTISHEQLREKVVFTYFPEILENQLRVYPSIEDFSRYFRNAGFSSTEYYAYGLERYQASSEFIEVAQKKLWSMFRPISTEGLERGVEELRRFERENPGQKIRNDETITLVVARKSLA